MRAWASSIVRAKEPVLRTPSTASSIISTASPGEACAKAEAIDPRSNGDLLTVWRVDIARPSEAQDNVGRADDARHFGAVDAMDRGLFCIVLRLVLVGERHQIGHGEAALGERFKLDIEFAHLEVVERAIGL